VDNLGICQVLVLSFHTTTISGIDIIYTCVEQAEDGEGVTVLIINFYFLSHPVFCGKHVCKKSIWQL